MNPLHPLLAFSLLLPLCRHSMASDAAPTAIPAPKPEAPRQAIEQFLGLTAIWMLEMEWTHAYANKTPKAEDFRNAMLAAGLQQCPADFQDAWLRQTARPGRNYAAPVLRKYGVRLVFIRVYSGVLKKGDTVYNPRTRKTERVGRIIQIQADQHTDIDAVYSGDIAAIVGLRNVTTGDTITSPDNDICLEPPTFPETVISMAVEPKTKADQEKMSNALGRLSEEDPTFRVKTDEETGQTLISGMGELHLEIIIDRLMREFKVEADIGKPQIAYRETITAPAHGDGKLVKQSGGRGQYGHVVIDVKPNERGKGLTIENKIVGGAIPKEYMNAVYAGLNEAMTTGVVAGYPVVDVHVEVVDGSYHEVDSNENAFKMAAIFAMKDAFKKAKPIMLEPIMSVEASTPTDYQGDIMGDLNRRRGQISNMENKANACILKAMVPLSEMFGYSTAIRTLSSGRASYSMEPSHFEQVPQNLVDQIVSEKAK